MRLAAAPISWGVCEVPGWGFQLARDRVLEDSARLGMRDMEAGPPGFLPADAREARDLLARRSMRVIGGFVTAVLHQDDRLEAELAGLEERAAHLAELGSEMLVLAAASGRDDYDVPAEVVRRSLQPVVCRSLDLRRGFGRRRHEIWRHREAAHRK